MKKYDIFQNLWKKKGKMLIVVFILSEVFNLSKVPGLKIMIAHPKQYAVMMHLLCSDIFL